MHQNSSVLIHNSYGQPSYENIPSINTQAFNLGRNDQPNTQQLPNIAHQPQGFPGRRIMTEDMALNPAQTHPRGLRSPPREFFGDYDPICRKFSDISVNSNSEKQILCKRRHSESSTESFKFPSSKYQKTSEESSHTGVQRKRYDTGNLKSRSKTSSNWKINSKAVSKNFNKRGCYYDMKRLAVTNSVENKTKEQQELKSRLKAMVYSNKVLREDKAIVVPSLPSILSLPTV